MNLEYTPIRDYAAIGDCHGSALAGRDGGIDWCALARFDADPVFCRLLERAAQLFDDAPRWYALAETIRADIEANAIDPAGGHLRQAYDGGVDAAVLLAPMLGFPLAPETLERTIAAVEGSLAQGDFVARYRGADGLVGSHADRARRSVIATGGRRGVLASIGTLGPRARLTNSLASRLAWP